MARRQLDLPMDVDYEGLAKGFLDLFDETERTVLRFGMLPAKKMEVLERSLREKFQEDYGLEEISKDNPKYDDGATHIAHVDAEGWPPTVGVDMNRLVEDLMFNVSMELYKIGDLVV